MERRPEHSGHYDDILLDWYHRFDRAGKQPHDIAGRSLLTYRTGMANIRLLLPSPKLFLRILQILPLRSSLDLRRLLLPALQLPPLLLGLLHRHSRDLHSNLAPLPTKNLLSARHQEGHDPT